MKKTMTFCFAVLAACLLAAAPVVAANHSLTASGENPAFAPIAPPAISQGVPEPILVNDGSFELGGNCNAGTSAWAEVDTTQCTPWVGDWGPTSCLAAIFPTSAVDGTQAYWAGGFCGAQNINSATQTVTIPADSDCQLHFYWASVMNGDDDSVFYIRMDGVDIWTLSATLANNTAGVFGPDSANFCDAGFSPGDTVSLSLGVVDATVGAGLGGNVLFDFLQWGIGASEPPFAIPTLGVVGLSSLALALALGALVYLRRRRAA